MRANKVAPLLQNTLYIRSFWCDCRLIHILIQLCLMLHQQLLCKQLLLPHERCHSVSHSDRVLLQFLRINNQKSLRGKKAQPPGYWRAIYPVCRVHIAINSRPAGCFWNSQRSLQLVIAAKLPLQTLVADQVRALKAVVPTPPRLSRMETAVGLKKARHFDLHGGVERQGSPGHKPHPEQHNTANQVS